MQIARVQALATTGIVGLWLRDMPFSITAAVGFIALSGVPS
jgi:cobalt-zinc-cadmium resistance protein CzcA